MVRNPCLVVACCLAAFSACGADTGATVAADPGSLPVRMAGDEVMVACGGTEGWPPSVMTTGLPQVLTDDEATSTFQAMLDDPELRPELELSLFRNGVDVEWRVLRDGGDSLMLGLGTWTDRGPVGADASYLALDREGDRWVSSGWGQCNLEPVIEAGLEWAEVSAVRSGGELRGRPGDRAAVRQWP